MCATRGCCQEVKGEPFVYQGETEQFWIPIVLLIRIRSHVGKRRRETRTEGSPRKGGSRRSSGPGGSDPPGAHGQHPAVSTSRSPSVPELSPAIANSTHLLAPTQLLGAFPHSVTGPEHMEFPFLTTGVKPQGHSCRRKLICQGRIDISEPSSGRTFIPVSVREPGREMNQGPDGVNKSTRELHICPHTCLTHPEQLSSKNPPWCTCKKKRLDEPSVLLWFPMC